MLMHSFGLRVLDIRRRVEEIVNLRNLRKRLILIVLIIFAPIFQI